MTTNWKSHFMTLQDDFIRAKDSFSDFHHGVVFVEGDLLVRIESLVPNLYVTGGSEVIHRIIVPLSCGGCHIHFFCNDWHLGDDRKSLDLLQRLLNKIDTLLAKVPARVVPAIAVPAMASGLEEKTVRWMYVLHWLAALPENKVFHSEFEFLLSKDDFTWDKRLKPWNECSSLPDFDPLPYLTLTASTKETLEQWKRRFANADKRFPEVIASSLTKPVLYASANAIELLLQRDVHSEKRPHRVTRGNLFTSEGERRPLTDEEIMVLAVLKHHHGFGTDKHNFKDLDNGTILAAIVKSWPADVSKSLSKSKIQRTVVTLFGSKLRYRRLCQQERILAELHKIEEPHSWNLSPGGTLKDIAARDD